MTFVARLSTPIGHPEWSSPSGHPEQREGSLHAFLRIQPRSPRLHLVLIALRLLDPSLHGLFPLLTTRFAQDDFCGTALHPNWSS